MTSDRPMNEHEGALHEVVRILLLTVMELGADPILLTQRMRTMANAARELGRTDGAATIELLIRSVTAPIDYTGAPPS